MPELRCTAIGPYLAVPASALLTWRLAVTKPKLSARPICPLVPIANLTDRNETQYQLMCHVPAEPNGSVRLAIRITDTWENVLVLITLAVSGKPRLG
jgi:hypothetical protein